MSDHPPEAGGDPIADTRNQARQHTDPRQQHFALNEPGGGQVE
jgi:hypothetical protein